MAYISFIYRIGSSRNVYYGKYVSNYFSDDHEGVDMEIADIVEEGIEEYRKQKGLSKLKKKINIGILSFSRDEDGYCSAEEIQCFDFYYTKKYETYINGKLLVFKEKEEEEEEEGGKELSYLGRKGGGVVWGRKGEREMENERKGVD